MNHAVNLVPPDGAVNHTDHHSFQTLEVYFDVDGTVPPDSRTEYQCQQKAVHKYRIPPDCGMESDSPCPHTDLLLL